MIAYNTLVVLAGTALLGACSGMVGSFAVLRKRALMGDALSHAALPGLCLAFLIVGERHLPSMLLGAFLTGVLGIAIIAGLRHSTRVKEDAAIGIVLSVFYGAGIALSRIIQNQTTGGSKAGLNSYILGQTSEMILKEVYLIGAVALFCLVLVFLFYKEFKVVAFDPQFAAVQGWPAFRLDVMLMTMVAVTVVIGLPAVGVILMAALLIIPAAAARLWTQQLGKMLPLSAFFGMFIGAAGTMITAHYRVSAGPTIVLVGTALFLISLLLAPHRGIISRLVSEFAFQKNVRRITLLRFLYDFYEPHFPSHPPLSWDELTARKSWKHKELKRSLRQLQREGLLSPAQDARYLLTDAGLRAAVEVVQTQRLWALCLAEHAEATIVFTDFERKSLEDKVPREMLVRFEEQLRAEGRWPIVGEIAKEGTP